MQLATAPDTRWQLYRLLSEPVRLKLLALCASEELAVGELAELLAESQPNVSRHTAPLRERGLLTDRRQGARTLVRLAEGVTADPVVADALAAGTRLCAEDGSLARVGSVLLARDARTREYFSRTERDAPPAGVAPELPAYLYALSLAGCRRGVALDAGTGDGALLDALAPQHDRVIALDRSEAQLARAARRVEQRGYAHVELVRGEVDGPEVARAAGAGADVVVASRMLHHAPVPRGTLAALGALVAPGGCLVVLDYAGHDDERLRDVLADVWMGFDPAELAAHAARAGLQRACVTPIPPGYVGTGADAHVPWIALVAHKSGATPHQNSSQRPPGRKEGPK